MPSNLTDEKLITISVNDGIIWFQLQDGTAEQN